MTTPTTNEGETLCGEHSCRRLLRDMEGATCFDCGVAPRYCPDHIATNPCGSTQCWTCHEGESCWCHICERAAKEAAVEARHEA